jgi:hypothetical protein
MASKDPRLERAGVVKKNDFCVYFHKKKNTNEIFYVGKGRRWRQNQKNNRNKHWHNVVNKYGFDVCIVADNLTNKKACLLERFLISEIGLDYLVNYTLGGEGSDGYKHTEESIAKMRKRKFSEEHIEKLSNAKKTNPTMYWLGKKRSQETIKKISQKLSNQNRMLATDMLIRGEDRKKISKELNLPLTYLRGLACRLRKEHNIEKLIN